MEHFPGKYCEINFKDLKKISKQEYDLGHNKHQTLGKYLIPKKG